MSLARRVEALLKRIKSSDKVDCKEKLLVRDSRGDETDKRSLPALRTLI
jgi:hypothetical protein